jgi:hypothetical protein
MSYVLFLDDVRDPAWVYPQEAVDDWMVCRSYAEAVAVIEDLGMPDRISFDHDLGPADDRTGYDLAHYLVSLDLDSGGRSWPDQFEYQVHSANPVGAENIRGLLDSYIAHRQ